MSSYLLDAAESAFVWYLRRTVAKGRIVLHSPARSHTIPDGGQPRESVEPTTELSVLEPAFFLRVLTSPSTADLVFAEAYMRGEVSFKSDEELLKFFQVDARIYSIIYGGLICVQIFIDNRDKPLFLVPSTITSLLTLPAAILSLPVGIVGRLVPSNILTTARQNISAHYDLGNDMFRGASPYI